MIVRDLIRVIPKKVTVSIIDVNYSKVNLELFTGNAKHVPEDLMESKISFIWPSYTKIGLLFISVSITERT